MYGLEHIGDDVAEPQFRFVMQDPNEEMQQELNSLNQMCRILQNTQGAIDVRKPIVEQSIDISHMGKEQVRNLTRHYLAEINETLVHFNNDHDAKRV